MNNDSKSTRGVSARLAYPVLALTYVVTGKLGLMLAMPPGYASPIFPPAGIAIAAAYIWGWRTLPWIFLGSFTLNLWTGASIAEQFNAVQFASALIIAAASMLQAAFGGWLLRRMIGYPSPIDSVREVFRLLFSAPLICLVSATLSVSGLTAIGVVESSDWGVNWGAWWVGDTLGMLVMFPLVMVAAGEPRSLWRGRFKPLALPMLLVFGLFVAIFIKTNKWEQSDVLVEFNQQSQQTVDLIRMEFDEQEFLLEQLRGFFLQDRGDPITDQGFGGYVRPMLVRFPMIQALEWAPRVEARQREAFEAEQSKRIPGFMIGELGANGGMRRAEGRAEYYPVAFVQPFKGNQRSVGFDLASQADRRAALETTVASGNVAATAPIRLVQEQGQQAGMLLLMRVEEQGRVHGIVLSVLRMGNFIDSIMVNKETSLKVRFVDLDAGVALYDSFGGKGEEALFSSTFEFGGRHYRLQSAPTALYLAQHRGWQSWGVLVMGLLGTGVLGGLLLLLSGYTVHMEEQVRKRTRELAESETKIKEITTTLGEGVYVVDEQGLISFINPEAERLLGWSKDELLGRSAHGLFHCKHEDGTAFPERECNINKVINSGGVFQSDNEVFFRKDETPMPVAVTSSPIFRNGRIEGAVVAFRDVTERKQAEQKLLESEERFRLISTSASDGIVIIGVGGRTLYWNPAAERIFGYVTQEVLGRNLHELVAPERYREAITRGLERFAATGEGPAIGKVFEATALRKNGEEFTAELSISPFKIKGEWHAVGIVRDVSERKKMEQEYKTIIQTTLDGFLVVDAHDSRFLDTNDAYCRLLGYSREELLAMKIPEVEAMESPDLVEQHMVEIRSTGKAQFETRHRHKDGHPVDVEVSVTYLDMRGGILIAFVRDIRERKRKEEQIRQLAYYDTVTSLPNRRALMDRLNQALFQARRYQRSVAVMFLDLDHFKEINDTLGHDAGDELLRNVAIRLTDCIRTGDSVCRQGGDEFVIVLPEISHPEDATLVADKIIELVRLPYLINGRELKVTTSVGISIYPINGTDDARELMKKADIAMYEAKKAGRNRYQLYLEGMEA